MTESTPFFDITLHYLAPVGVVILLGLLGGKGAKLLHMPKVTGYLLTGILIGPSVLGILSRHVVEELSLVTEIALGLIMFALGGVFEIHHIRTVGKKILWLTLGQSIGAMVLTTGALLLVGVHWFPALLLGTIGIATAPAATLLVVREFEARGDFTDTLITVVAASNILCILGFELVYSLGQIKEGASLLYAALSPIYELGGGLLVGGAVGYIISRWEQHIDDQAEMLMIILAGVMLVTGLALTLNLQPLFATLVMGAVTTNLSLMHRLVYIELRQVEQPLYIAFFVLAGGALHLEFLPAIGLAGITYLVSRVAGKMIGTYWVAKRQKLSIPIKNYLGLGMLVQAGVAIGLVDIVRKSNPEIGDFITPIILSTIVIYETIGPPVIRYILIKAGDAQLPE